MSQDPAYGPLGYFPRLCFTSLKKFEHFFLFLLFEKGDEMSYMNQNILKPILKYRENVFKKRLDEFLNQKHQINSNNIFVNNGQYWASEKQCFWKEKKLN